MATGTFTIDTRRTFALCMLMSCAPKIKFQAAEQDTSADGRPKWEAMVACTWLAEPGIRPVSDVIRVTITSDRDPGAEIVPGSPVEIEGLRVGWTAPEINGRGGVRGGQPWYSAEALRMASSNGHRPAAKAEAAA